VYPGVGGRLEGGWYAGVPGAPPPPQIVPAAWAAAHFQVVVGDDGWVVLGPAAGGAVVPGIVVPGGCVVVGDGFGFGISFGCVSEGCVGLVGTVLGNDCSTGWYPQFSLNCFTVPSGQV